MQSNKRTNTHKICTYKNLDVRNLKEFENKDINGFYKQIVEVNYKSNYKCDVNYVLSQDIGVVNWVIIIMISIIFLCVLLFVFFNLFKFILM